MSESSRTRAAGLLRELVAEIGVSSPVNLDSSSVPRERVEVQQLTTPNSRTSVSVRNEVRDSFAPYPRIPLRQNPLVRLAGCSAGLRQGAMVNAMSQRSWSHRVLLFRLLEYN